MSDETRGDPPDGRTVRDSQRATQVDGGALPPEERKKRLEERLKNWPIVQIRVAIYAKDAERPADVQWHIFTAAGRTLGNIPPETQAELLERIAQELYGVPRRLEEQGFLGQERSRYACSFCDKSQEQVHRLIAGAGGVYICNECIDLCREILAEENQPPARSPSGEAGGASG